jgi:hypothetical protein
MKRLRSAGLASTALAALFLLCAGPSARAGGWIATKKLVPAAVSKFDYSGRSVDIDGATIVLGARDQDPGGAFTLGVAYVYALRPTGWKEEAALTTANATPWSDFGASVAVSGDTIVVAADQQQVAGIVNAGSAYVFVRSGTTWSEQAQLTGNPPLIHRFFAAQVAIDGDTIVASDGPVSLVFVRSGTTWSQQALLGSGGQADIEGDTAVIGSPGTAVGGFSNAGAAHVYVRSGTSWSPQAQLDAGAFAQDNGFLGRDVAIHGERAIVGAPEEDHSGGPDRGAAYVFERSGTTWSLDARLTAFDAKKDLFATSVGIHGDTAVCGAPNDKLGGGAEFEAGSARVFVRLGGTWIEQDTLVASSPASFDHLGSGVGISGTTIVAGRPEDDNSHGKDAGAVHVFDAPPAETYCTAGTSASGCRAAIGASGTPSASGISGFDVLASSVEGTRDGMFFYGQGGRQASPWGSGTSVMCILPSRLRGGVLPGNGTPGACDGAFAQDLNARWCATCPKPDHNPGAGAVLQVQFWYRDPQNTSNQTTSLSDALEVYVGP